MVQRFGELGNRCLKGNQSRTGVSSTGPAVCKQPSVKSDARSNFVVGQTVWLWRIVAESHTVPQVTAAVESRNVIVMVDVAYVV